MKLFIASDIHTEFQHRKIEAPADTDVVVLAGDIGHGIDGMQWARENFGDLPIVMVAGNHEFYRRAIVQDTYDNMRAFARECDIYFLQNSTCTILGQKFVGATYWTDFNLQGNAGYAMYTAQNSMNDYNYIRWHEGGVYRKINPHDVLRMNKESQRFFKAQDLNGAVVVTHHPLSPKSLPYIDPLSPAYASGHDELIAYSGAKLFAHGHTHEPSDYMLGDVRVYANPVGYPGQYCDHQTICIEVN